MEDGVITKELQTVLDNFHRSGSRSTLGAENAWRGYWLQALYIGARVAEHNNDGLIYLPETIEDLMVVVGGGTGQECIEFVQVKSCKFDAFHLSNLHPKTKDTNLDKDDSFFGHIYEFWKQDVHISARVVVFGNVDREMSDVGGGLQVEGSIRRKMIERYGYPDDFFEWLKEHLSIEQADEQSLTSLLEQQLSNRIETGAAVELARDYIMSYIYSCCRNRIRITDREWQTKLVNFALQASSARGYLENYGHTIVSLSQYLAGSEHDVEELEAEYRSGASAVPEHIALNLDIERPTWQSEISKAFESKNIVVVRAASGQGKSTVCYRWLMDRNAISDIYLLNGVSSTNAPGIVAALRGLAAQQSNFYAYVEGGADAGWVDICTEINRLNCPNLKLLVSVREDDAARACYDASKVGSADVFLLFDKHEAGHLYKQFNTSLFPSFESAWKSFGGEGPLMEFIYSLSHDVSLRKKLEGQVRHLRKTEHDSWLTFLYLASAVGEYGLPSSIARLKSASGLNNIQKMLEILENEMLLRSDGERGLVFPMHPYRSKLLAEIIAPMLYQNEEELVLSAAKCASGNFGAILIPYLSKNSFSQNGLDDLVDIAQVSWKSSAQALRAMVWKDARCFYYSTADLRQHMISAGLPVFLLSMIAGDITSVNNQENWLPILELFPDEAMRDSACDLVAQLACRKAEYRETDRLLSKLVQRLPSVDMLPSQASEAGFVLAYVGNRDFGRLIPDSKINALVHVDGLASIDVDRVLDLLVGYNSIGIDVSSEDRQAILFKTCQRDGIVWLDSSELVTRETLEESSESREEIPPECLNAEGLVRQVSAMVAPKISNSIESGNLSSRYSSSLPNDVVMRAVCDLRRLFPNCGRYCVQYVGIKALTGGIEIPDCEKHIPEKNLTLNWMKLINQFYIGMCKLDDNIARDWKELEQSLKDTVSDSIKALDTCSHLADALLRGNKKAVGRLQEQFGSEAVKAKEELDTIDVGLPICALDTYAFSSGQAEAFDSSKNGSNPKEAAPAFGLKRETEPVLNDTSKFLSSLQNHFNSINNMLLYALNRGQRPSAVAVSNVAQACAKVEACNSEFSKLFGGRCLISEKQKEKLFQHAVYWNYLWCRKDKKQEKTLFKQAYRAKTLQELKPLLVDRFSAEPDIENVAICDGLLKITYKASSEVPFSEVAVSCIRDLMKCDLESSERFIEWWLLYNGPVERIEVAFVSNGCGLIKKTYLFSTLMNHMNNPGTAEVISPAELAFSEGSIDRPEKAIIAFQASLETCKRLHNCIAEVDKMVSSRSLDSDEKAMGIWGEWCKSGVKELENIFLHLDDIAYQYSDDLIGSENIISELKASMNYMVFNKKNSTEF